VWKSSYLWVELLARTLSRRRRRLRLLAKISRMYIENRKIATFRDRSAPLSLIARILTSRQPRVTNTTSIWFAHFDPTLRLIHWTPTTLRGHHSVLFQSLIYRRLSLALSLTTSRSSSIITLAALLTVQSTTTPRSQTSLAHYLRILKFLLVY
jgi:hypothetical protein